MIEAEPQQSDGCRFCHNLQPKLRKTYYFPPKPYMLIRDWVGGLRNSSCLTCTILRRSLECLAPDVFDEADSNPEWEVFAEVQDIGLVTIYEFHNGDTTVIKEIQLLSSEYPRIGDVESFREIASMPGDESMWEFLRSCISACLSSHELCRAKRDPGWFPERLIRIESDKVGTRISLMETHKLSPGDCYITLSHCWGSSMAFRTTKANLARMHASIEMSELPQTFRDCIATAEALNISYAWIDAICIVQDDRTDWARNSQVMGRIYENATFTVAACASPDSTVPFLGPEAPKRRDLSRSVNIVIDAGGGSIQVRARDTSYIRLATLWPGPLQNRCWAWQERYLSTRVISFLDLEAVWSCATAEFCEHNRLTVDDQTPQQHTCLHLSGTPPPVSVPKFALIDWSEIVSNYSEGDLTFPTDRLPALSGVASRYQQTCGSEYMAGLWRNDFPQCLSWYRRDLCAFDCDREGRSQMQLRLSNQVPSWSWASIPHQVHWLLQRSWDPTTTTCRAKLVDVSCQPSTSNVFGEIVVGGYLELRAKVVDAEMTSDGLGCGFVQRPGFGPQLVQADCALTTAPLGTLASTTCRRLTSDTLRPPTARRATSDDEMNRAPITSTVTCLLLYTFQYEENNSEEGKSDACVLVLGQHDRREEVYERVAIGLSGLNGSSYRHQKYWHLWEGWPDLQEWENWEAWFEDAETKNVRIV